MFFGVIIILFDQLRASVSGQIVESLSSLYRPQKSSHRNDTEFLRAFHGARTVITLCNDHPLKRGNKNFHPAAHRFQFWKQLNGQRGEGVQFKRLHHLVRSDLFLFFPWIPSFAGIFTTGLSVFLVNNLFTETDPISLFLLAHVLNDIFTTVHSRRRLGRSKRKFYSPVSFSLYAIWITKIRTRCIRGMIVQ